MASNFQWVARKNGDIEISHLGKHATTLRGLKAEQFRSTCETTVEVAVRPVSAVE